MRTPHITRKTIAAALAPLVLAGGMLGGLEATGTLSSPAHASHAQPAAARDAQEMGENFTRGFDVTNASSHRIELKDSTGRLSAPHKGSVLEPGQTHHYELDYLFLNTVSGTAKYEVWVTDERGWGIAEFKANMNVGPFGETSSSCSVSPVRGAAVPPACRTAGSRLYLEDKPAPPPQPVQPPGEGT